MATVKDWIKVLIAALTGTLVTLIVTSLWAYPGNIEKKFNEQDQKIIKVEEVTSKKILKVKEYTDKQVLAHETRENERDKMLIKYLDQRFDDLKDLIKEKNN